MDRPKKLPKEIIEIIEESEILEPELSLSAVSDVQAKVFSHDRAKGGQTYLNIEGDMIEVAALVDERQAEGWVSQDLEVRIQLHLFKEGAAACLTLFSLVDDTIEDELSWPIEIDGPLGPKILKLLKREFRFELNLYKKKGNS